MRTRPKRHFKKADEKPRSSKNFEVLKWLMFLLTALGIFAWISGAAYLMGYWGAIGLDGPLQAPTLQQTALVGFVGAIRTWLYAPMVMLGIGFIIVLMGIRFKWQQQEKISNPNSWSSRARKQLSRYVGYDGDMGMIGVFTVVIGYLFLILVEVPLIVWSIAAHHEGEKLFIKQTCEIRAGTALKMAVIQVDGKAMFGKIIDRSDKIVMLSDGFKVHVLSVDKPSTLAYSINIPPPVCDKDA